MFFDEFDICYGVVNKVVKHELKNGKGLDNICSKEVLWYEKVLICLIAEMLTVDYSYKNPQGPFLQ